MICFRNILGPNITFAHILIFLYISISTKSLLTGQHEVPLPAVALDGELARRLCAVGNAARSGRLGYSKVVGLAVASKE